MQRSRILLGMLAIPTLLVQQPRYLSQKKLSFHPGVGVEMLFTRQRSSREGALSVPPCVLTCVAR